MILNPTDHHLLNDHPQLRYKLENFLADYALTDRPALIMQCRPTRPLQLDLALGDVRRALRDGAGESRNYWSSLASSNAALEVFDGLASVRNPDTTGWTAELHADGHLIAGLWQFVDQEYERTSGSCLVTWHQDFLEDFGALAIKVATAAAFQGSSELTCTLLHANALTPIIETNGRPRPARPIARQHLQWPVETVNDVAEIGAAASRMAKQFSRIFLAA